MNKSDTALCLILLGAFSLLGLLGHLPSAAAQSAPDTAMLYTRVAQVPRLHSGEDLAAAGAAIAQRVVWPPYLAAQAACVVVRFVVERNGMVSYPEVAKSAGEAFDEAVLAAVRQLPPFSPGRQAGKPRRVAVTLPVAVPGPADRQTPAERTEAQTLKQGTAQRRPGEADSAFLRRVLPVSYPASGHRVAYAWRPSAFGKQLLFVVVGGNGVPSSLFVLDPYQPDTYAVQELAVVISGDCDLASMLSAIFFADINHDGQKELLGIGTCSALEPSDYKDDEGRVMMGHVEREGTVVYCYAGLDKAGQPHYDEAPTPRYLDGVATAAEARAELADHQRRRRPAPLKAAKKSK